MRELMRYDEHEPFWSASVRGRYLISEQEQARIEELIRSQPLEDRGVVVDVDQKFTRVIFRGHVDHVNAPVSTPEGRKILRATLVEWLSSKKEGKPVIILRIKLELCEEGDTDGLGNPV